MTRNLLASYWKSAVMGTSTDADLYPDNIGCQIAQCGPFKGCSAFESNLKDKKVE